MLFELGVTLADSLTVHPEAIPTTLARRRRPRPVACKNQAATGHLEKVGAAGGGAATLFPRLPRVPRLRTVRVASLRRAPPTARSARTPAQRQPAFCSRRAVALVFTSPTVPGSAGLVHGLSERRVERPESFLAGRFFSGGMSGTGQ
jgi:hypothetical protein